MKWPWRRRDDNAAADIPPEMRPTRDLIRHIYLSGDGWTERCDALAARHRRSRFDLEIKLVSYYASLALFEPRERDWNLDVEWMALGAGIPREQVHAARTDIFEAVYQRVAIRWRYEDGGDAAFPESPMPPTEHRLLAALPPTLAGVPAFHAIRSFDDPDLGLCRVYAETGTMISVYVFPAPWAPEVPPDAALPDLLADAFPGERDALIKHLATQGNSLAELENRAIPDPADEACPFYLASLWLQTPRQVRTMLMLTISHGYRVKVRATWQPAPHRDFWARAGEIAATIGDAFRRSVGMPDGPASSAPPSPPPRA